MSAKIGFGGYRIHVGTHEHTLALQAAIDMGVRVFDTASTYTNGESESLIGVALSQQPRHNTFHVTTKVGIVESNTLDQLKALQLSGETIPDVIWAGDTLAHCMHPLFLDDVLHASRTRLHRACINTVLLHNPELQLQVHYHQENEAHKDQPDNDEHVQAMRLTSITDEFYNRIGNAFTWLERERAEGRIETYGISSNTLAHPASAPDALSLDRLVTIAQEVGGSGHGFAHIQIPFNIIEHQAITDECTDGGTLLEKAEAYGLQVTANRPLNAIVGTDLIRLCTFDIPMAAVDAQMIEQRIHSMETVEHDTLQLLIRNLDPESPDVQLLTETFRVAGSLCQAWNTFEGLVHYRDMRHAHLQPRVAIASRYPAAAAYVSDVSHLLNQLDALYALEENVSLEELRTSLCTELHLSLDTPLQHIAIHAARCTKGINTVLVGMRTRAYVRDVQIAQELPSAVYTRDTWLRIHEQLERLSEQ